MTPIKILSTHHTSFTVSNVERTKAMFMDAFGFSQVSTSKASGPVAEDVTGVKGASMKFAMLKAASRDESGMGITTSAWGPSVSIHCLASASPKRRRVL